MCRDCIRVSHFYEFSRLPKNMIGEIMAEFSWNGVKFLTLDAADCKTMLKDPNFSTSLPWYAQQYGITFGDVHAPYGQYFDLDLLQPLRREEMIKEHSYLLERLGNYGIKTYTMHVGAVPWCAAPAAVEMPELRKNAIDTLEKLLPVAEKAGIIICIENAFEPVDSADEVLSYVKYFDHPNIRCCFDCGHANIMRKTGKDLSKYKKEFNEVVWRNALTLSDEEFNKMAPYIVTCHLHDNDGYSDAHTLPGTGTVHWDILMDDLYTKCPLLQSIQNESSLSNGNCIGKSAAVFRVLSGNAPDKNEILRNF